MKIILVGGGKVGTALARQLSEEGHNVTVVDTNKARVEHLTESYDVLGIVGNGSSITTLSDANPCCKILYTSCSGGQFRACMGESCKVFSTR